MRPFATLDDGTPTPLLDARLDEWKRLKGSQADRSVAGVVEEDDSLGRVVVEDFTRARVLDRLLLYERRIESSLYRTMGELRRLRAESRAGAAKTPDGVTTNLPAAVTAEEVPCAPCRLPAAQESGTPARLGSFGANTVAGGPPVVGNHGQDAHATETPDGVTTNLPTAALDRHSNIPSFRHSSPAADAPAEGSSCETKPKGGSR